MHIATKISSRPTLLRFRYLLLYAVPIVVISSQFRTRAYEDKSIDAQAALRIICFFAMFLVPLIIKSSWRCYLDLRPQNFMYVLCVYFMANSVSAPNPPFSAFNAFSLLVLYVYSRFLIETHGLTNTVRIIATVGFLICGLSLIVYAVNPEFARMRAWDGFEFGAINRLRGITGSANAVGSVAALTIVVMGLFKRAFEGRNWWVFAVLTTALCLICLVMSNSRTSMAGALIVFYVYFVLIRGGRQGLLLSGAIALVAVLGFALFGDQILSSLSRSGNVEELTSGTGRTLIWSVVIEMWAKNPIIGYGFSASNILLPADERLFTVAAHAHNMYLEVLFAGGLIGFAIFLVAILYPLRAVARTKRWEFLSLYIFFLLRGITEAAPFSSVGEYTTFIFFFSIHGIVLSQRGRKVAHALRGASPNPRQLNSRRPQLTRARRHITDSEENPGSVTTPVI